MASARLSTGKYTHSVVLSVVNASFTSILRRIASIAHFAVVIGRQVSRAGFFGGSLV